MPEPAALPVIIDPFSKFEGVEIAGNSPDELARNLAAGTRIALAWRGKPRRACPDLWALFAGHQLATDAAADVREVAAIYQRLAQRQQATLAPQASPSANHDDPSIQLSLL